MHNVSMNTTFYSSKDAARLVNVDKRTLKSYVDKGVITPMTDSLGRRLYTEDDINTAIEHANKYKYRSSVATR